MKEKAGNITRREWLDALNKIAYPVLFAASNGKLKEVLPLSKSEKKRGVGYLEAIGRTVVGIAPWLELKSSAITDESELKLQSEYREMTRKAMANAVDEKSPDYCVWNKTGTYLSPDQPLVDAAYFCSAILKAPIELWEKQPQEVKDNIIKAIDLVRLMKPNCSNWLMFAAMVEACRYKLTGIADGMRVEYAVLKHYEWYKGDGVYGDGENLACDYYNSYVIQPMLEEVTRFAAPLINNKKYRLQIRNSIKRLSEIQERMIAPDGSYPFLGRSITYRMAAFQGLAHCAYMGMLPKTIPSNAARCALTKVIKKAMSADTLFDENGFLTKGLYGKQEKLTNYYTNTGSLYMCLAVFLPLGLSPKNKFWNSDDALTTWEKIWNGENLPGDDSLEHRGKI
ncbi:MAG: DUF2264 domain-containing protein [Oscillospiraceae bacterium]